MVDQLSAVMDFFMTQTATTCHEECWKQAVGSFFGDLQNDGWIQLEVLLMTSDISPTETVI